MNVRSIAASVLIGITLFISIGCEEKKNPTPENYYAARPYSRGRLLEYKVHGFGVDYGADSVKAAKMATLTAAKSCGVHRFNYLGAKMKGHTVFSSGEYNCSVKEVIPLLQERILVITSFNDSISKAEVDALPSSPLSPAFETTDVIVLQNESSPHGSMRRAVRAYAEHKDAVNKDMAGQIYISGYVMEEDNKMKVTYRIY